MSIDIQASVVLITSRNPKSRQFGTGFVIHQDEQGTYLLTCAHVVDDVGGADAIDIEGKSATVVKSGGPELDLALLRVDGPSDKPSLKLRIGGKEGSSVVIAGFQLYAGSYKIRPLQAKLDELGGLTIRGKAKRVSTWDLMIVDDYQLQPGNSGSPVVDENSGQVLAVVSHREEKGQRGTAIAIEALPDIWPDMPTGLLGQTEPQETTTEPTGTSPAQETKKESKGDQKMSKSAEIFFSYAHEDEELRDKLAKHLRILERQGTITAWHDREITAGSEWAGAIDDHLNSADIILLLISADFMASDYCYDKEMTRALERHEAREAVVIPVILRSTKWTGAPFGKLQALPRNGKPVATWTDEDEAFLNITEGILKVAEGLARRSSAPHQSAPDSTPATSTAPTSGASIAAGTQASAVEYNTGTIRDLLSAAFSDQDFTTFCYDNFKEVHSQFSSGMGLNQKVQQLIVYCEKKLVFVKLLNLVEEVNPAQFQRYAAKLRR